MKYVVGTVFYVVGMSLMSQTLFPDAGIDYPEKNMVLTLMAMPGAFIFMDLISKSQEGGN